MFQYSYLECTGGALFISKLFHQVLKSGNTWSVYMLEFYYNPSLGNHVQVFAVSSYGVNMILDATAGVVSMVGPGSLPTATRNIAVVTERLNPDTGSIDTAEYPFRTSVNNALTWGHYYYDQLIYQIDTSVFYNVGTFKNVPTDVGRLYTTLYVLPAAVGWTRTPVQNWGRFGSLKGWSFPNVPQPNGWPISPPPSYTYFSPYYWRMLDVQNYYYCFSQWSIWPVGQGPYCG